MARRTVDVSPVDSDDLRDVMGLWLAARVDSGSSKEAAGRALTDGRLSTALRRPGVHSFVARIEGERIAAFQEAGVTDLNITPVSDDPAATVAQVKEWVS